MRPPIPTAEAVITRHSNRGILPLLTAASLLLTACSDDSTTTQPPPTNSPTASSGGSSAPEPTSPNRTILEEPRPISYGQGQILHLGDREIDTGLDFLSLDMTDDGAALTTVDGAIWFTDGIEVEQVGATLGGHVGRSGVGWPAQRPRDWVVNDSSGSLLAWLEYPGGIKTMPELVVYDSERRAVVARQQFEVGSGPGPAVAAVAGREIFVSAESVEFGSPDDLLRYTVHSGVLEPVDAEIFEAATRGVPRALVVGSSAGQGQVLGNTGPIPALSTWAKFAVKDSRLDGLFDPHTGEPLDIRVPDGYQTLWFVQWLDDDQFTLISRVYFIGAPQGDLLVCQIVAGRCTVAIESSTWTSAPLLPGDRGGVGADLALSRAMDDAHE